MQRAKLSGYPFGTRAAHGLLDLRCRFLGDLVGHQARADLGYCSRGDYGLRSFSDETAADTVDLQRRPCPEALEQRDAGLTHQLAGSHFVASVGGFVEGESRPGFPLLGARRPDLRVKSWNEDAAVAIF